MTYPFLIILALLPSFIWLLFYLRKDTHPESNWMVLKIFFYGLLSAIPVALIEMGIFDLFDVFGRLPFPAFLISILNIFVGVALVEELIKYLVVKEKVLNNPEFDEPLDAMLYMIIAALGFAALENILILLPIAPNFLVKEALMISGLRFVGATFLHTLASGLVGYFLALSFFETEKRLKLLATGLGIAILLHGLYNFSIIRLPEDTRPIIPAIILIALAIAVSEGFKKLKEMASVCLPR
jgi:RsiW-degrading membrane proteinase PrsW (M82 family)